MNAEHAKILVARRMEQARECLEDGRIRGHRASGFGQPPAPDPQPPLSVEGAMDDSDADSHPEDRRLSSAMAVETPAPNTCDNCATFPPFLYFLRAREWEDPEIERMRPRSSRVPVLIKPEKVTEEWFRLSVDAVSSVASGRTEPGSLRKAALKALRRLAGAEVIGIVQQVLLEEWENYGEEAIDVLAEHAVEASIGTLREFALMVRPDRSLRLRCVEALAEMEIRPAVSALRDISERSPDPEIRAAALDASKALAGRVK